MMLVLPRGIAFDPARSKMYWTERGATPSGGRVRRANLDGSAPENVVSGLNTPLGLALNAGLNKLCWAEAGAGQISCSDLDGLGSTPLITGLTSPTGLAIDASARKIYWHIDELRQSFLGWRVPQET